MYKTYREYKDIEVEVVEIATRSTQIPFIGTTYPDEENNACFEPDDTAFETRKEAYKQGHWTLEDLLKLLKRYVLNDKDCLIGERKHVLEAIDSYDIEIESIELN